MMDAEINSLNKVRRKDLCGSVRAVYVLEKLPDVNRPVLVEAGRYNQNLAMDENGVECVCGNGVKT